MTYVTQPAKPGYDQNWETYGDALDSNIRQAVTDLTGPVTLARACPGTVIRCPWNGTAWTYAGAPISARPSSRTDIYFELTGAPVATESPLWMLNGDSRVDAVLRSTGEVPLATTANRVILEPLRGVTTEQLGALTTLDNALKTHSRPPTVRIVFQTGTAPSYYAAAITALRPHAYIMGCILDSTAIAEHTETQVTERTRSFVQAFGSSVDIWEVGNELNGEWVGTQSEINAKALAAYNVVKVENSALNLKAAVTLNYWPSTNCYALSWEEMNTFAAGMPAAIRSGTDYALISFYETACSPPEQPTVGQFTQTLNDLSGHFPNARVGLGEVGWQGVGSGFPSDPTVAERKIIADRYYGMHQQLSANLGPKFIGGFFWWNYYQDIVQATQANSLWATLDAHIAAM